MQTRYKNKKKIEIFFFSLVSAVTRFVSHHLEDFALTFSTTTITNMQQQLKHHNTYTHTEATHTQHVNQIFA